MLIAGKLVEQVFLGVFLSVFRLSAKVLRNGEYRHDGVGVDAVGLHLVDNLLRVFQHLRMVGEDATHLFGRLQPFLFGVVHSCWVVEVLARAEADESVVRLAVLLFHKVDVIGGNDLHVIFLRQVEDDFVHLLLAFVHLGIATRFIRLMPLDFKVIVITE